MDGVMPTAWHYVGIRSPQCYASLSAAKGEHHEGRPEQNFRQEIYAGRIPSLFDKFKPRFCGVFKFMLTGVMPTAWHYVGIRSPQCYASLSAAKGEHHEGRPEQNFRQEIYAGRIPSLSVKFKSTLLGAF